MQPSVAVTCPKISPGEASVVAYSGRKRLSKNTRAAHAEMSTQDGTVLKVPAKKRGAVNSYRYQWTLFADWCAATDVEALPASAVTLAEFLDKNPASDAVQLRRVSAINRAHFDAGHPIPGQGISLRLALDSERRIRTIRRAAQYQTIAAALPTSGSTAALFGRRDAVLLLLAGAGVSYSAITDLERDNVTTTDAGSIWIGGHHRIRIDPNEHTDFRPAEVWHRWDTVLQFSNRYPSTRLLIEHLTRNTFPDMTEWPHRPGPVAIPIDRWGHLPIPAAPMTAAEIGTVIAAYRTGTSPQHTERHRTRRPPKDVDQSQPVIATEQVAPMLDSEYYSSGVNARRRAHTALADVPDMVDDVEDRIEALLQRTLDLLGDETAR